LKIAFLGDIVGRPGRRAVRLWLEKNRSKFDLCVANGENAAAGFGITEKITKELLSYGIDVITGGNHTWDRKEVFDFIDNYPILRPVNFPDAPGKGYITLDVQGKKVTVLNMMGTVFMACLENPFLAFDKVYHDLKDFDILIVDFHAEATSEKQAFGFYVSDRANAVFGTHTHVQTNDLGLIGNTLYLTDVGMCGALNTVIGMGKEEAIYKFTKQLPVRFKVPEKPEAIAVNGVTFDVDDENRITSYSLINDVYVRGEDGSYHERESLS
jgi:metallophosphoesterase (TIGR00282 family)